MQRLSRRAWLCWCAAAAAVAARGAHAACEIPAIAHDPGRATLVFLDDRERPQGARLEELRQRLAAHGLGEERAHLATVAIAVGDDVLQCALERAGAARAVAICTASAPLARAVVQRQGDIPVVFALHGDPVGLGIVDRLGERRMNATGFTFETPVSPDLKAFELVADAFPAVRRVLVLADDAWGRHPARAAQLERVRQHLGLEASVASAPRDPAAELRRLGPAGAVAAYIPSSDLLLQGAPELVAALHRLGVPHLGGDERLLRHGAMLTFAPRRFAHWDAMAAMVRAILTGTPARELAVQWPAERLLSVSLAPWQRLGMSPPRRLLRRAHVIL
jgi:ABC-type uncharacterized transport system substrate-binding protein